MANKLTMSQRMSKLFAASLNFEIAVRQAISKLDENDSVYVDLDKAIKQFNSRVNYIRGK